MAQQPRKHHFVPQFYLAGFTKNDSKDGTLHVFDRQRRANWSSTPKGSAHKRDYHAVDPAIDGDPMSFEKKLGQFETQWSQTLANVIEKQSVPEDESFGDLMMFVAFMAVRVLRIREILSSHIDQVSKATIQLQLATELGRASFRATLQELGQTMPDEQFEELVRFGQSGQYEVDFDQTWHVKQMLQMAIDLAPLLSLRNWTLWISENSAPDLICSDSPVTPTWISPMQGPFPPAFGTPNTIVSVPLNRRIVLVSILEKELPYIRLGTEGVARVNSMTAMHANQLYSAESDFVWMRQDESLGNSKDLIEFVGHNGDEIRDSEMASSD